MTKPILHITVSGMMPNPEMINFYKSQLEEEYNVIITSDRFSMELITEESQKYKLIKSTLKEVDLKSIYETGNGR